MGENDRNVIDITDHNDDEGKPLRAEIVDNARTMMGGAVPAGTDMGAVLVLALSISSWIIPLIGAITALILAPRIKKRIRQSNGALTGEGLVTAAQIVSVLNILAIVIVVWGLISLIRWIF